MDKIRPTDLSTFASTLNADDKPLVSMWVVSLTHPGTGRRAVVRTHVVIASSQAGAWAVFCNDVGMHQAEGAEVAVYNSGLRAVTLSVEIV